MTQYVGKPVRVVGTVQGYDDSKQMMTLIASDGGQHADSAGSKGEQAQPMQRTSRRRARSFCLCHRSAFLLSRGFLSLACSLAWPLLLSSLGLLSPLCSPLAVPVSVMVAAQNVGVVWESGQILEVIGAAQGNHAPTMMEYTSIPFAKGFGQQHNPAAATRQQESRATECGD